MNVDLPLWLDNPIFVKHLRSRLRRPAVVSGLTVVIALQLLLAWYGSAANAFFDRRAFTINLAMQGVILVFIGAGVLGSTVAAARESGILDFHRISPLSPWSITLGFFFGAPVLQYLLAAVTLPMGLNCVAHGGISLRSFFEFLAAILMVAWLVHSVSMLSALCAKKPSKSGPVGLLVVILVFMSNLLGVFFTSWPNISEDLTLPFLGYQLPWIVYVAMYLLPPTGFALVASMRKIRSQRAKPLSKPQAIGFLFTAAFLILGGLWQVKAQGYVVTLVIYVLMGLALFLCLTITPNAGEYLRGERRAIKRGQRRLSAFDDLALNRIALVLLCAIVLAGSSFAWNFIEGHVRPEVSFSLSIAVAVLSVAYFGLGYQYFALRAPTSATALLGVMVFLLWGVPAVGTPIAQAAGMPEGVWQFLGGFTPITGLAMISGDVTPASDVSRIAALVPSMILPFVFNALVLSTRRQIDQMVGGVTKPTKPADPFEDPEPALIATHK